jgi:two-component system sensor histidine kinase UhpB
MLSRYLSVRYEQGVQWRQIVPWAAGALAVAVIVLTGVLTWNRVLQREVRQRTARLEESEFVARSTFDQAAVGIAHVSPAGRFLRVNRKLCELVGYSEAELLERGFPDITHPDDVEADVAVAPRLVAGEIDSDVREKRYVRKDGTIVWAERSVAVAGAWRAAEPWFVVAIQDITARKQAERAVLAYQGRLRELALQLLRAEERERRIIAGELHDQVGQSLSAMRTLLAAARKESGNGRDARLDDVSECLRQAIRDTRNIMSSLSDPTLDRLGLSAAICEWLKAAGSRHGLETHFSEAGEPTPLGPDASAMLFRSVRELVTNVVKHARASGVSVGLRWTPCSLEIVVEDDGVGMAADSASRRSRAEGGFGLLSIEERMADVGGSFTIATSPGHGVRATLVAPLETVS